MLEDLGIASELKARRESFADRHPALARFFKGKGPDYAAAKSTRITVNAATGERTVEEVKPPKVTVVPPTPEVPKPPRIEDIQVPTTRYIDERGKRRTIVRPNYSAAISLVVCQAWGVRLSRLLSPERSRRVAYPRFAAFLMIRERTTASTTEIGKRFDRDHTTVLHGLRVAEKLYAEDPEWRANYDHANALLDEAANPGSEDK